MAQLMMQLMTTVVRRVGRVISDGREARTLRQLERLDQSVLNDLGVSHVALVGMSNGHETARCAVY